MQKHKNKIIAAAVVVVVLAALFWWGGNAPGLHGWSVGDKDEQARQSQQVQQAESGEDKDEAPLAENQVTQLEENQTENKEENQDTQDESQTENQQLEENPEVTSELTLESDSKPDSEAADSQEINPETGKDRYNTDPVPEGKPLPVEPQEAVIGEAAYTCTISISCATILDNPDWLNPEKTELVPEDGWILPAQTVTFYEGESVFNVLLRTCKQQSIHMEYSNTPMYNSAYIEGIHNLYEFDCGEGSGWMYRVNGWFPNYGCSRYQLADGDVIEWVYTCNYGDDVGGGQAVGG